MNMGNSLAVPWLGLCSFTAKGLGSILGQGTKIPQAPRYSQKTKKPHTFLARTKKLKSLVPSTLILYESTLKVYTLAHIFV